MKKNNYLWIAALAAAMTGCAKDSELADSPAKPTKNNTETVAKQPVQFGAYVNRATTRAGATGTLVTSGADANKGEINLQDKGFGIIAYYTDDNLYSSIYQPNFMYNTEVTYNSSAWEYSPVQYWPNEFGNNAISEGVDRLSFFAYAPYVDVTPVTGIVENDDASGIVGLSRNAAVGDPFVKYYVNLDPAQQVDFCWGVNEAGKPHVDLTKQGVDDQVKFYFNHALAALNVQIDAAFDELTPQNKDLAAGTRVYVRSVTFEGFVTKGAFNLNTTKATWYDLAGNNYIDGGSVTVYDGRTNGREGQSESANESPLGLNPGIIQTASYSDTTIDGVTKTPVNLFDGLASAPIYVIPSGQPLRVTIVYDVETATNELSGYLSDGVTHGTTVENKITKTITLNDGTAMKLEAGKTHLLKLHLGLTTVKFDATVDDWGTVTDADVNLPSNALSLHLMPTTSTVWVGEQVTTPTVLVNPNATLAWSSDNTSVANVNAATGAIEVAGAGVANITVTASYAGSTESATYTLNVNEVTGITVTPTTDVIAIGGKRAITATLTHTNNGTITTWPEVAWESDHTSYVTISPASATASQSGSTTSALTKATGVAAGEAIVTATVSTPYAKVDKSASATLTCSAQAVGYYRGYDVSPGILMRTLGANDEPVYSLTSGDDPFELYGYYDYGKNTDKTAILNKYYFKWSDLRDELGADGSNIDASSDKLPDYPTGGKWNMPTGLLDPGNSWYDIVKGIPELPIQIEKSDGTVATISNVLSAYQYDKCYAFVDIEKESIHYYGVVLFRDGSFIHKEGGLQYWGMDSSINHITYDNFLSLKQDNCLFISTTGYYTTSHTSSGEWRYIDDTGYYWSSNRYQDSNQGKLLSILIGSVGVLNASTHSTDTTFRLPVRLVKKMD